MKTMDEDQVPDKSTFLPFADLVARYYHLFDHLAEFVNNGVWSFPERLLQIAEVPKDETPEGLITLPITENTVLKPSAVHISTEKIRLSEAEFWDSELSLVQDYIESREIDQPRPTAIDIGSHPNMAQEPEVKIAFEPWELSILKNCVKTILRNYDSPTVMDSQALSNPNQEPEAEIVPSTAKFSNWELAYKDDIETVYDPESTFLDIEVLSCPTQDPEAEIALSATEIVDLKLSLLYYNNNYNEKMEIDGPSPTAIGMEAQPNMAQASEVQTALLATEYTALLPLVKQTTEKTEIDDPSPTAIGTEAHPNMAQETGDLTARSVTEDTVSEPPISPNSSGTMQTDESDEIVIVIQSGPNPTQEEIDNKSIIVEKTGGKLHIALTKLPLLQSTDKMLRNRRLQLNIALDGDWFKCPECVYKSKLRYIVSSHYHARHLQFLVYNCKACAFKSFHRRNVNRHYHSEHINLNRTEETRRIETTGWVVQVPLICVGAQNCKLCKFIAAAEALPGHERANGNVAKILKCVKRILPFHIKPP